MCIAELRLLYQFLIEICAQFSGIKWINDEISIQDTLRLIKIKYEKALIFNLKLVIY